MSYRRKHITPKIRSLRRKKRLIQHAWFWIGLLILIIISVIGYFVVISAKFKISEVEISGIEKISSEEIKNFIAVESSERIFLMNKVELTNKILHKFPLIESVNLKKDFPQTLKLTIKERGDFAVLCNNENLQNCFKIDRNGVIFEVLNSMQPDNLIIIKESDGELLLGSNLVDKNIILLISNIQKNLNDNFQISVKTVFVANSLVFTTSENWKIYFDPTTDIDLQITKMNILLRDEIPANIRKNLQYIYLQYKDRAYYK